MRVSAAPIVGCVLLWIVPAAAGAQERSTPLSAPYVFDARALGLQPDRPVARTDAAPLAIDQFSAECVRRLTTIQHRLQEDSQVRSAGAVLGLGAIALGALHGRSSLTLLGTQGLRFGFGSQLARIRKETGFVVEPSIGPHAFALKISRSFGN
jgi:hypothetical protein